jgi:hypothetical protein
VNAILFHGFHHLPFPVHFVVRRPFHGNQIWQREFQIKILKNIDFFWKNNREEKQIQQLSRNQNCHLSWKHRRKRFPNPIMSCGSHKWRNFDTIDWVVINGLNDGLISRKLTRTKRNRLNSVEICKIIEMVSELAAISVSYALWMRARKGTRRNSRYWVTPWLFVSDWPGQWERWWSEFRKGRGIGNERL